MSAVTGQLLRRARMVLVTLGATAAALMGATAVMAVAAPVASAAPWACDGTAYLTQFSGATTGGNTLFQRADRQPNGTYKLTQLGTAPAQDLNAIGFRPQDGNMYGISNAAGAHQLVRISRDPATGGPVFTPIGFPAGSGIPDSDGIVVGAVLADGTYFVWDSLTDAGAVFDVSGPTATLVTPVTAAGGAQLAGDFAVSPIDGQIYGVNSDNPTDPLDRTTTWGVYRFTLSGGTLTRGPRVADGADAGAGWFDASGRYIQYANGTTPPPSLPPQGAGLYASNLTSGQRTFLGSGPVLTNVDGTSCANGLELTKDATPRTVTAGTELTYTYTLTSRSLADAPVAFVDHLPAGMTYVPGGVTVSPQIGTPNNYANTGTFSVSGSITPQQTVTIAARVRVDPGHACDADVQNQAQGTLSALNSPPVTVNSDDPTTPADPSDPTTIHVNCTADVGIAKSVSPTPVVPGTDATYSLVVTNHGPSTANNVSESDPLPKGLKFVSTSPGCTFASGTVTCAVGSLAAGASKTYTVTAKVASSATSCSASGLANTATVSTSTQDPNPANNSSSVCPPVAPKSHLDMSKSASAPRVIAGGQLMYTLVVKNTGPSDARGVSVSDPTPAGLSLVSAKTSQGSCSVGASGVTCSMGTVAGGGSAQVLVTATVSPSAAGQTVSECATATSKTKGAGVTGACAPIVVPPPPTPPQPTADLRIVKHANHHKVTVGQTITYRLTVTNHGPDTASNAKITDTASKRLKVLSAKTGHGKCRVSGTVLRCSLGTIANGKTVKITVKAKVNKVGTERNAASTTSSSKDPKPSNNLSKVKAKIVKKQHKAKAVLHVRKIASPKTITAGDSVTYRIRVSASKAAAHKVRVCDRLPLGLSFTGSHPKARLHKGKECWTIKTLGKGKHRTFTVQARALKGTSGRKTNHATATAKHAKTGRAKATVRVKPAPKPPATPVTGATPATG